MLAAIAAVALYLAAAGMLALALRRPEAASNRSWLPLAVLALVFHGEIHAAATAYSGTLTGTYGQGQFELHK